jgi:hypothetical protein
MAAVALSVSPVRVMAVPALRQSPLADPVVRQERVETLRNITQRQKAEAIEIADTQGFPVRWQIGRTIQELMRIDGTRIWVYTTTNSNAAISAAVTPIRQTAPYFLDGAGQLIGVWDGGDVRSTHQELIGRITKLDNVGNSNHATHVAGTIIASGVVSSAKGMSPAATIDSYDFNTDLSEMTGRAMAAPGQSGTLQTSNHSYTYVTGWDYNYSPPRWYGTWQGTPTYESDTFGQYGSDSRAWDDLCYDAPYYLPIKAAGNDRSDSAPSEGATFEYYTFPSWKTATYDSAIHPRNDGWDNGGYDTMTTVGCAKNILTIGAANDAVTSGQRDPSKATVAYFSNWGPTDDGRIKPDIVANGVGLYSSLASSDTSYGTYSGTSMATPNTTGAANLILQQYSNSYPGQYMRSATLKGLIIHTADDIGNPGPDYSYGFGLINTQAAVDVIIDASTFKSLDILIEDALTTGQPKKTYHVDYDGTGPIKATLCWTDPAGPALSGLDNTTSVLVNDLDLRIIHPNGTTTYMPYVLDPNNPGNSAATGDNIRDNVEMVEIEVPPLAGVYTVEVTYKGTLTNSAQDFSLLTTGNSLVATPPVASK